MSALALAPERPSQSHADEDDPLAAWDSIPLFMKSLPPEQGGRPRPSGKGKGPAVPDDNIALEALQSLMYEGNASEVAADLKAHANELFQARKFRDALGFYTRALDEVGKDLSVEERRVLWCNRAAANLELGNLGATLRDISLVLSAPNSSYPDPPSSASNRTTQKALLRSARALLGLEKLPEAMDALQRLRMLEVEMGEGEKDVGKKVREEVEKKVEKKELRERESAERRRRESETEVAMREALKLRGVILPKTKSKTLFANCPSDIAPPHFDPDALPPSSLATVPLVPSAASPLTWTRPPATTPLIFPVFLLLPLAQPPTRDLCLAFHTAATFGDVLLSMEHDPATLQLYIATTKGRVLKVGAKLTLGKVLDAASKDGGDGWTLGEGWALEMVGVPKGSEGEEWIKGWKEEVKTGSAALL